MLSPLRQLRGGDPRLPGDQVEIFPTQHAQDRLDLLARGEPASLRLRFAMDTSINAGDSMTQWCVQGNRGAGDLDIPVNVRSLKPVDRHSEILSNEDHPLCLGSI